jgi:hypothetical protein
MSGVKNDAYAPTRDADALIRNASWGADGSPGAKSLSDLFIEANETPSHNPSDRSVK